GAILQAVDLNADGKLDLIVDDGVLLGNGNVTFQSPRNIGTFPVVVGDFNGDGKLDLLAEGILLGNGDGTFQPPIPLPSFGKCGILCQVSGSNYVGADFNDDGKLDLATILATRNCDINCSPYSFSLIVMIGEGDGTFELTKTPGPEGFFLLTGDFNGDGKPDLVAAPTVFHGSPLFHVLLGRGNGTFQGGLTYDIGSGPGYLLATDLNGDHLADIVTANYTDAAVSVLLNRSPATGSDLSVHVDPSSANITVGSANASFTVTVLNQGPEDDSEITLRASLPSAITLASAQPSQGACSGTTVITCELGSIAHVSSATVHFTVTPTAGGILTTSLQVTGAERDLNPTNDLASFEVNALAPDFTVSPSMANLSMMRGEQVSETLTSSAQGGFSGTITLACSVSGPAPMPTCGITPASVTPGDSATLTVSAPGLSASFSPTPSHGPS